jgi:hypothetical protein
MMQPALSLEHGLLPSRIGKTRDKAARPILRQVSFKSGYQKMLKSVGSLPPTPLPTLTLPSP